jgi:hypothetical protein
MIQFILAIALGWFISSQDLSWVGIGLWALGGAIVITFLTLVIQHATLPPASRSRTGLTVFTGQLRRLLLGTFVTTVVAALAIAYLRQRLG